MSDIELHYLDPGPLSLPAVSSRTDTAIHASTAAVVLVVAGIAAYISYWHAYAVVRQYGESGVTALLEPGTIDGVVYASSMVILYAARHRLPVPRLARWMLVLGIAASFAVNVAQRWSHGPVGAATAAWPAVALVGSYELLAWMIRTAAAGGPDHAPDHGVPQTDQLGTNRRRAVSLIREAVTAAEPGDGASAEPGSKNDRLQAACAGAQIRGPGPGFTDQTDQGNHRGGSRRESIGPRGPGGPLARGPAVGTAPAGDIDAAAVTAYRASLREGRPLSERKLAEAFGRISRRWARNRMAEARQGLVAV
jgi:Protein of unknown function (DUF2637)